MLILTGVVVLVFGLTFLFGFAQNNGVIEVLVHWCVRAVRGRVGIMPWFFFALTALGIYALVLRRRWRDASAR